jgi:hypothetical protein
VCLYYDVALHGRRFRVVQKGVQWCMCIMILLCKVGGLGLFTKEVLGFGLLMVYLLKCPVGHNL